MKIRNKNKKLLAGLLGIVMITTPLGLTACDSVYKLDEQSSYSNLTNLKVVTIKTVKGKSVWLMDKNTFVSQIRYFDVFSGEQVFSTVAGKVETKGVSLICEEDFLQYLIGYERIQSSYTMDEIEEIFNQVKQDFYSKEKGKELVKK